MGYTKGEWKPTLRYDCGCQILERVSGKSVSGTEIIATMIDYCPKHKAAPKLYDALKELLKVVRGNGKRSHHNQCYGLDVKAHPDCELCKSIAIERIADKAIAEAEGK